MRHFLYHMTIVLTALCFFSTTSNAQQANPAVSANIELESKEQSESDSAYSHETAVAKGQTVDIRLSYLVYNLSGSYNAEIEISETANPSNIVHTDTQQSTDASPLFFTFDTTNISAGKYTITATIDGITATCDVTVVAVDSVKWQNDSGNWVDGPGSIASGDTLELKAFADPSSAAFPSGNPEWKVDDQPTGAGLSDSDLSDGSRTVSVALQEPGSYTFSAHCGNSNKSIIVTVIDIDLAFPGFTEAQEDDLGYLAFVNDDDDAVDGVPDNANNFPEADDDNLGEIVLSVKPQTLAGTVTLKAVAGAGNIRVFDGTSPIDVASGTTFSIANRLQNPLTLQLEGLAQSAYKGVVLRLEYDANPTCCDLAPLTVADILINETLEIPGASPHQTTNIMPEGGFAYHIMKIEPEEFNGQMKVLIKGGGQTKTLGPVNVEDGVWQISIPIPPYLQWLF